ncbi:hypothetical protein WJX81_007029 [Elliptochloris bilobata]|uniref:Protein-serine/threonine phosphatase n=1 Tax=Elliptochloris bilobata TaxID=381761 RepID=A0AAW1S4N7_9CHLO
MDQSATSEGVEFCDLDGQSITKHPGELNGESVVLKNLKDCSVYLLDYTGEVEVTGCTSCQIFIGPVDGPAIFSNCKDCQVAVAAQQFQAKACTDVEFGLYCATQPTVAASTGLRFSCWMGAYPGLAAHFRAAGLNPGNNHWDKVQDISADSGAEATFELVEAVHYWVVPLADAGPLENPVSAADGSRYQPGVDHTPADGGEPTTLLGSAAAAIGRAGAAAAAAPAAAAATVSNALFGAPEENGDAGGGGFFSSAPAENGHAGGSASQGAVGAGREHPKVAAVRAAVRERLAKQEADEASSKDALVQKAASYLETFYQKRNTAKSQRAKENRGAEMAAAVAGPEGDGEWEKALSLINFSFGRPSGSDLSRYKTALQTGCATLPGDRYGILNQDVVALEALFSDEELRALGAQQQCLVAAVLDGHGMLGEAAASRCCAAALRSLRQSALRTSTLAQLGPKGLDALLQDAFLQGHAGALTVYRKPPLQYSYPSGSRLLDRYTLRTGGERAMYASARAGARLLECGTTCTLALLQGRSLAVANAGDSSAVLGWALPGGGYEAEELTVRHCCREAGEAERFRRDHSASIELLLADGYISVKQGRWKGYQLSMTRALGHDLLAHHGVVPTPTVAGPRELPASAACLVLASDGVWDAMTPAEAVNFVMDAVERGATTQAAAEALAARSVEIAQEQCCEADNTTAAVLVFGRHHGE